MTPKHDWTSDAIALLTSLWAAGHSAGEIARRMGTSRNSIIGKVHRIKLVSRPSPIIRDGVVRKARNRPLGVRAKLALANAPVAAIRLVWSPPATLPPVIVPPVPAPVVFVPRARAANVARTCEWIEGNRPAGGWGDAPRCQDARVPGGSWCVAHRRRVFQPRAMGASMQVAAE